MGNAGLRIGKGRGSASTLRRLCGRSRKLEVVEAS